MNFFILINIILCILLFEFLNPVFGHTKEIVPNIAELWDRYKANDAGKYPTIKFPYEHCFKLAARKYDLTISLLLAVARGESNFNPKAKSNRNCHGIMQILWPQTAKHLGIYRLEALYHPCTNIDAGAKYLRELVDHYDGNYHLVLAAYNYGPSRIRKNSKPNRIPNGAQWYSSYIYHHLKYVTQGAVSPGRPNANGRPVYSPDNRIEIITFNKPYRAASYYQHLQSRAPGLKLEWYRIGLGRYQVAMRYTDKRALNEGKKTLKNLGVKLKGR